jgi:dienelactone hydrolase
MPDLHRVLLSLAVTFTLSIPCVYAQVRPEIRPLQSMTLTTQQFLLGEHNGKPALLAGELRIPISAKGRIPAVVLLHGSGGLGEYVERWGQEINDIGVAAFVLDSFSGRGITSTIDDQTQLSYQAMIVDGYRALAMLGHDSRIDPDRIAVMGFSRGAVASVYSSMERFRKAYAPANLAFAAHIGLYAPCYTTYRDDENITGKPIRLFHGTADEWDPIEPCRQYVERLKKKGADITLTEYAGAQHTYDNFRRPQMDFPNAQNLGKCSLTEGDHGTILNSKTGKPFTMNDACVEKGTRIAYDEAATVATVKAVKDFLTATFKLKTAVSQSGDQ